MKKSRIYMRNDTNGWFNVQATPGWVRFRLLFSVPWGFVTFPSVASNERRIVIRRSEVVAVTGEGGS